VGALEIEVRSKPREDFHLKVGDAAMPRPSKGDGLGRSALLSCNSDGAVCEARTQSFKLESTQTIMRAPVILDFSIATGLRHRL